MSTLLSNPRKYRLNPLIFSGLIFFCNLGESPAQVGRDTLQLIVATAPDWNSHRASLQAFQRASSRQPWQPVFRQPIPVLLGRNGLAWGRGLFQTPNSGAPQKRERDGRAPAGIFQLGQLFGYATQPPQGCRWPYHRVTQWDAYVDDPTLPEYNRHVQVDPRNVPPWFEKQRMRLGDAAYTWMLEIRHNQQPVVPGAGSAIFFHVRRGPDRPSSGCTTMRQEDLEALLRWLDPAASPYYVLLPREDYLALRGSWRLP
ncbi:MAG: L,D-transpeptidase family protein [Verrucomicrobiales bacterium]|nr:L,D-transpeptidase family protein [Verrucomicrobiales bacterium]